MGVVPSPPPNRIESTGFLVVDGKRVEMATLAQSIQEMSKRSKWGAVLFVLGAIVAGLVGIFGVDVQNLPGFVQALLEIFNSTQ